MNIETKARAYCINHGLDPDDVAADGGVLVWMVVAKDQQMEDDMTTATNVAELVDQAGPAGVLVDLREAKGIELITGEGGAVWINVDGSMLLRIAKCDEVYVDTSNALKTDREVAQP